MREKHQPFFSIGVTTYDRIDLLQETLSSILSQSFPDFEIILGNDNPRQVLSPDTLNIYDERISFVNRPENLGELANMNDLLERSRGRYFTWLADDDLYAPTFLETVHKALIRNQDKPVIFTSYMHGAHFGDKSQPIPPTECRLCPGSEFLKDYLSKSIMAIGCYGVFKREYLQRIGGMEKLGQGFSPYADNWLVIKNGLLDHVGYVDTPLIFFRTHERSLSYTSPDIESYLSAQKDLMSKSCDLLRSESLRSNAHECIFLLLVWCIRDFGDVVSRSRSLNLKQASEYIEFVWEYVTRLRGAKYYRRTLGVLMKTVIVAFLAVGRKGIHYRTSDS